jgi:hypothetical protein
MTAKNVIIVAIIATVLAMTIGLWGRGPKTSDDITAPVIVDPVTAARHTAENELRQAESALRQAQVDAKLAARKADFAAQKPAIIAKVRKLNATGKYQDVLGIGMDYGWVGDKDLDAQADLARSKIAAKEAAKERVERRKAGVSIGMSKQDALESSWGRPESVNTTTNALHTQEQWVYPGNHNYLYFEDGILTGIQN